MKRLLSLILITAMAVAVIPVFPANANETADSGVLFYDISTNAYSDEGFAAISELYNKETGKKIANVNNDWLAFLSYKGIAYSVKSSSVYKLTDEWYEAASGNQKIGKLGSAFDLSKTAPYELLGRTPRDNSPQMYSGGYSTQFRVADKKRTLATDETDEVITITRYESDAAFSKSSYSVPHFVVKVKIPSPGKYDVSAFNRFTLTNSDISGNINAYENKFGYIDGENDTTKFDTGLVTRVYFGKTFEEGIYRLGRQHKSATVKSDGSVTYSSYTDLNKFLKGDVSGYEYQKLGLYDSRNLGTNNGGGIVTPYETELGTIEVEEAGEYFFVFYVDEECLRTNPVTYTRYYKLNAENKSVELSSAEMQSDYNAGVDNGWVTGTTFQIFALSGIELTPLATEDEEYAKSFDAEEETYETHGKAIVNAYAYADNGEQIEALETSVEKNLGETYTYTAPEKKGKNFLYWAKGASKDKLIISYEKELTYKPSEGQNHLIAVYEDKESAVAKAEFYNANGDRLYVSESVTFPKELPSMAGYGKAEGWICYNNGETYTGKETDIELSGTMIFVAKYGDLLPVTVNGKSYTYGDMVELIAEDKEGKVFKGWKKNGEIVSVNKNYTFLAYENCDVEAVYADEAPNFGGKFIKILIDTFTAGDATAIMAEFIGITEAVEKGIIANGNKIPMKGNGNQFTVEADVDGTYEGYAIIKDGTAYTQIKDGNIEVK